MISCKKDFEKINTNPNAPVEVEPNFLLRQILYNTGEEMSYEGFVAGNLLSQHFTMVDFNLFDRHNLTSPQLGGNPWPVIYKNLLDNEKLFKYSETPIYKNYRIPALILKAYLIALATDIYGDVPFFEAVQADEGIENPVFDTQEEIYTAENGILDLLDQALELLQNETPESNIGGDILFNGDLTKWEQFAYSLKVKYLIRISERINVSSELQQIYDQGIYMQSNIDNATFDFSDGRPNSFRMAQLREGDFNLYIMSKTIEEVLKDYNDPRIDVLFRTVEGDTTYNGLINGPDASQTSISVSNFSLPGAIFRENTGDLDANFMTSWETHFLWAEATQKGLISANAQMHYESGVIQAFEYWNTPLPTDYFSGNAGFGVNGADPLKQIITQKWLANIINGYEGWIEYRRTGFPELKDVTASLNGGLYPVKMPYPSDETTLNSSFTGNNSINTPVWWDNN